MRSPELDITRTYDYLDDGAELPTNALELYFLTKGALKHTILIGHQAVLSREGVRDGAIILARCARRLAVVAQALADSFPEGSEKTSEILVPESLIGRAKANGIKT